MKYEELFEDDMDHEEALHKTGYWGNEGAGCLIFSLSTKRFLIGHRSPMVEEPNTWGTFGGAIDSGEDPKKAAIREAVEETSLSLSDITDMPLVYVFKDENSDFRYHNFIVIVDDEYTPTLNWENSEAKWFNCNSFPNPLHFGLKILLDSKEFQGFVSKYC